MNNQFQLFTSRILFASSIETLKSLNQESAIAIYELQKLITIFFCINFSTKISDDTVLEAQMIIAIA